MIPCEHALPVENRIRSQRQAAGLSQQELARRCDMTRQAMNAIEAGQYMPSTLVAMRLAKALGCRVEDLFPLSDASRQIDVEWLGKPSSADVNRTRIQRSAATTAPKLGPW